MLQVHVFIFSRGEQFLPVVQVHRIPATHRRVLPSAANLHCYGDCDQNGEKRSKADTDYDAPSPVTIQKFLLVFQVIILIQNTCGR